jgi:hypothetical protein
VVDGQGPKVVDPPAVWVTATVLDGQLGKSNLCVRIGNIYRPEGAASAIQDVVLVPAPVIVKLMPMVMCSL